MDTTAAAIPSPSDPAETSPLQRVFDLLDGPSGVLRALHEHGIDTIKTPWAVNKWLRAGRLPWTDYTGETNYAAALERAVNGQVTARELLEQGRKAKRDE